MLINVDVTYRIANICSVDKRYIYFIADPPHLIKTLRNCLFNSGYGCYSRLMWNNGYDILWKHIKEKYHEDDRTKMFIVWQTYVGIKLTVHSSIELTRFLLNNGIEFVLSGMYSQ